MKLLPLALLLAATTSLNAADAWIDLFNGQNLKGWKVHGGDATFTVEDGAIVGHNGPGHNTFLCTQQDFADFELEFEVKLLSDLNSGVQIRSRVYPEARAGRMVEYVYGPQVEIEAAPGEAGYIYGERAGGWLTPKDDLRPHDHFKAGEWNHYRIVARGFRIQTWINGVKISDLTAPGIYADHARGFIGLQVHSIKAEPGTRKVAWRHLRLRVLDQDK